MAVDCCPKTFTGFCLNDNTPIALTLNNGYIISWTNLTTGAVTIGNPPAGTGLCDVSSVATVEIEPLTCDKDSVTICPGVEVIPITATDLDIRNLLFLTDKVDVSGSVVEVSNDAGNPLPVTLDAAALAALENITVTGTVTANLGTIDGAATETTLAALLTELGQKYEGGPLTLDAATLAALETVTVIQGTSPWIVNVDNFPAGGTGLTDTELRAAPVPISGTVNLGTIDGVATETTLAAVLTELGQKLESGGEVSLSAATLAALENITVTVSNPTETGLATETTLTSILTELGQKYEGGAITLDAATLTALETVTVLQGTTPWTIDDPHSNNRFKAGERLTIATQVSSAGDNTIVTPTVGARLRVMWIGMSSSEVGAETLTIIKFGAGGAAKYRWYMGAPGAFSHWEIIEGATNESLIVNLSIGSTVQVNVTYEEFV